MISDCWINGKKVRWSMLRAELQFQVLSLFIEQRPIRVSTIEWRCHDDRTRQSRE